MIGIYLKYVKKMKCANEINEICMGNMFEMATMCSFCTSFISEGSSC